LFDVENQLKDVPAAFKLGVTSHKVFMTYAKLKWMTDDYWMTALMDVIAQERGLSMVHAENGLATDYLEDKYNRERRSPVETFTEVRPDWLEAEALNRAMMIAHVMGSALYVVHNSAATCLEPLRRGMQMGWRVIGETCPQYLALTSETTRKFKAQAKIGPPLRTSADNEALWSGLADGTLSTIGSDSAPKLKKVDDDFIAAPYGAPSIETMLRIVYHEGVNNGRITLPKMVEVMCENPAKIFGLYPKKGTLQPGSDADLILFDPARRQTVHAADLHSGSGFTLYEGREVMGVTTLVMQRGAVIVEDNRLVGKPGRAQFMPTDTSHLYK
jgi:dihydropyrimidinase